ncbi:glutaminase A [Anabaena subtropica]|uniref:Glutaminase n=1 Tax=Anabaena subtropica FACHB-260 TaxID=2692884 RepID=A0ABR8CPR8_9NOST|nr:glutaminase A [Anabaena subtropica]MBD2345196.1 glutaminase A [Anabaena subtropica FACHB-260]
MVRFDRLDTVDLSNWIKLAKTQTNRGRVAERIPRLAVADAGWFAVYICCQSGKFYSGGDTSCVFPLMSVIKPLSLLYLLEHLGAQQVLNWVGMEPSDAPFNSLEQLVSDGGQPRNPMINSGAITLADKLPGNDASNRTHSLCQWLNQLAGCQIQLDEFMLASVRLSRSPANQAIANYLSEKGHLENIDLALDTYEQICCLSGTVEDLALLGKLLALESARLSPQHQQIVNSVMLTCGLYQASAEYALKIGLPMKSGIGGGLLAIVPGEGAIAAYSPALDSIGNPVGAIAFVEVLTQNLKLSMFN